MAKRRLGDRRDGTLIRELDSMHYIMPLMYPNRCDNEAYISETLDLTNAAAFLEKKNAEGHEYKYNVFQLIVTAMLKTITLRPKMNTFIANYNMYQRNEVTAAFTIKKVFKDESDEGLAFIHAKPEDTLDSIHDEIYRQVSYVRTGDNKDQSTESMDFIQKLPFKKFIGRVARWLERHGWMPQAVIATDPYQSSVVLSNLGSIKLHAGYHHLTNWGTTSVMVIIGEIKDRNFELEDGSVVRKKSVDIGLTIDERLADGYYYSGTVRLFKHLIEHPELLERPLAEEVEF